MADTGTYTPAVGTDARVPPMNRCVTRFQFDWTSDASGDFEKTITDPSAFFGKVIQLETKPGAGGDQPLDLYDVTITNAVGADILGGEGADRSNTSAQIAFLTHPVLVAGPLTFKVANAGNAKKGTIAILLGSF
ncbi:MAG: hypothetical protein JRG73_11205 [Deltaproteobacteria bacterium]|nr:hypothetical protein [Deltaproteobacteria bacterium]MBW2307491.1 hypothetical protein [Deltaproteobacteria bacterium]